MSWVTLLIPLLREGHALIELLTRDKGRAPTDQELITAFENRKTAETSWALELERRRQEEQ